MKKINEVIVVEGKSDTKLLKSFFDCDTIETHGLGLNKDTIELIRRVNEKRGVILFLDPDSPGEKIRAKINEAIPNLKNVFVLKKDARTSKKVGVEHAKKEVILEALNNVITYVDCNEELTVTDLYELGLSGNKNSQILRDKISAYYKIGKCNSKMLHKRLNMLRVKKEDIEKVLND